MTQTERKTRVLVVDDQPIIAESLGLILTQNGFETLVAHSGAQAVAAAQSFAPDILITDVMMEGLNGIDTASSILGYFPFCQILLISGNPNTSNLLDSAHAGGRKFEILPKPIHPKDLLERLTCTKKEAPVS